jgi:hypothetical protein
MREQKIFISYFWIYRKISIGIAVCIHTVYDLSLQNKNINFEDKEYHTLK